MTKNSVILLRAKTRVRRARCRCCKIWEALPPSRELDLPWHDPERQHMRCLHFACGVPYSGPTSSFPSGVQSMLPWSGKSGYSNRWGKAHHILMSHREPSCGLKIQGSPGQGRAAPVFVTLVLLKPVIVAWFNYPKQHWTALAARVNPAFLMNSHQENPLLSFAPRFSLLKCHSLSTWHQRLGARRRFCLRLTAPYLLNGMPEISKGLALQKMGFERKHGSFFTCYSNFVFANGNRFVSHETCLAFSGAP